MEGVLRYTNCTCTLCELVYFEYGTNPLEDRTPCSRNFEMFCLQTKVQKLWLKMFAFVYSENPSSDFQDLVL